MGLLLYGEVSVMDASVLAHMFAWQSRNEDAQTIWEY